MKISTLVMLLVMVGGVAIGMGQFQGSIANEYGLTNITDSAFINRSTDINSEFTDIRNTIRETRLSGFEAIDTGFAVVTGAIGVVLKSFTWLDIFQELLKDIVGLLPVPIWAIDMIVGFVTISIIAGIMYAFLKVVW